MDQLGGMRMAPLLACQELSGAGEVYTSMQVEQFCVQPLLEATGSSASTMAPPVEACKACEVHRRILLSCSGEADATGPASRRPKQM